MAKKKKEEKSDQLMTSEYQEWPTQKMKLSELNPAPFNPRIITSSAKDGLKKSIEKYGLVQQIVWNKRTGNVVGGHQRLKILQEKGETEADVVVVDLPPEDEIPLNIALNSPVLQGDFTPDAVKTLEDISENLKGEFNQLKFNDLHEQLQARFVNSDIEVKQKKDKKLKPLLDKTKIPDERIVVTCPKCKSEFRKSDKKILYNAVEHDKQDEDDEPK